MVEPQGQARQEQALMLKGEDPALCLPGCVHQPVSFLETPLSHFTYWHHPPHVVWTAHRWAGAEGRTALVV